MHRSSFLANMTLRFFSAANRSWSPFTGSHPRPSIHSALCLYSMASTITPLATPRPSLLACDTCRRKHLKCDGTSPGCRRCATEDAVCTYTASRRGLARRNKRSSRSVRSVSSASRSLTMAMPTISTRLEQASLAMSNSPPNATPQLISRGKPAQTTI